MLSASVRFNEIHCKRDISCVFDFWSKMNLKSKKLNISILNKIYDLFEDKIGLLKINRIIGSMRLREEGVVELHSI